MTSGIPLVMPTEQRRHPVGGWSGPDRAPGLASCQNHRVHSVRRAAISALALVVGGGVLTGVAGPSSAAVATYPPGPGVGSPGSGGVTGQPGTYDCQFNINTDAFTGAYGTASAIGWEGNHQGVVTCLGGAFVVQDGINQNQNYGFGIYTGAPVSWVDADGYLPAQITTFRRSGAIVTITEFADRLVVGGNAFVAVYCRVGVTNPTNRAVAANPEPSPGLIPINRAPDKVAPHSSVAHDYVVPADRFGNQYPWPSSQALAGAGTFARHFAHMRSFWNKQLGGIAGIYVPDPSLNNAYRSGFIYTQIARSGDSLNTGVNGYESEFSHDVVGILTNLFTQGYYTGAHALLIEARNAIGSQGQYVDGLWTFSVPWAMYLMKTGDLGFVRANFTPTGSPNPAQPSMEEAAHAIAADRTGPSGTMEATDDIDTQGYWTIDDYEALLGLAAYAYLADKVGNRAEATWASGEYESLLSATDQVLGATLSQNHLNYLPCSLLQPNTANRCANPEDANWTSPLGNWAWEGSLFGATLSGPGISLIDATYAYGFGRLRGLLPPNTAGGFPDDYFSSGYNAAMGAAGLAGQNYRDQGILDYQFMIQNSQSGPYSFWESSTAPSPDTPWIGRHPAAGQGASPHAWGIAGANKVLLDSLVAEKSDGSLLIGRGIPSQWLRPGKSIVVTNFPTADGRRLRLTISSADRSVSVTLRGQTPAGHVLLQIPSLVDNIASTSTGTISQKTGTVTLDARTRSATIELRHSPADSSPS